MSPGGRDPAGAAAAMVLTDEQRAIVEWPGGPLMVLAGAGTGKTTVIVERVRHLLETEPDLQPEHVLVLTYNVKATEELLGRFEAALGLEVARRLVVDNFHGFGFRLIRGRWHALGLPADPPVLDEVGQRLLLQSVRDRIRFRLHEGWGWRQAELRDLVAAIDRARDEGVTPQAYRDHAEAGLAAMADALGAERYAAALAALDRPDGLGQAKDAKRATDDDRPDLLITIARRVVRGDGSAAQRGMTPAQEAEASRLAADLADQAMVLGALGVLEEAVAYEEYAAELRRVGAVDFGEQIRLAGTLLREDPQLRSEHLHRFRHVLVDEFQDANVAQIDLLELVSLAPGRVPDVVVVGDDDQSIYKFRGASYAAFEEFRDRFTRRRDGDPADLVRAVAALPLLENRRSVAPVLSAATRIIERSEKRLKAGERLVALRGGGPVVELVASATAQDEAEAIAERVAALREAGDVAILVRKRRTAEPIVAALGRRGIPVEVEARTDALTSPDVADLIAALRVIADPADDISVARLLRTGPWSLDNRGFARFLRERPARARSLLGGARLFAAPPEPEPDAGESPWPPDPALVALRARVAAVIAFVDDLAAASKDLDGYAVTEHALARLGLVADLVTDGSPEAVERLRAIGRFVTYVGDVAGGDRSMPLHALIRHLDDLARVGGVLEVPPPPRTPDAPVRIMTIHQAKGLEFDAVAVLRLCAGELPDERAEALPIPVELLRQQPVPGFEVDEERRLLYVAMTRARDRLVLSTVDSVQPKGRALRRSIFVDDLLRDPGTGRADGAPAEGALDADALLDGPAPADVRVTNLRHLPLPPHLALDAEVATLGLDRSLGAGSAAVDRRRRILGTLALLDDPGTSPDARAALRDELIALVDSPPPPALDVAPPPSFADLLREKQSHSSLSEYRACPLRYAFKYIYALRPPQRAYLTFGSSVHDVLESDVRARIEARRDGVEPPERAIDDLVARFDRVWLDSSTGEATPVERVDYELRARGAFEAFLRREAARDAQPLAVEAEFDFVVPAAPGDDARPIRIQGAIDRVDRNADGTIELIDYKTGRQKDQPAVDRDDQLTLYALALADGAVRDGATGEAIPPADRLTLFFVEHGMWITTTRTPEQLDAMRGSIVSMVGRMRAGDFRPTPGKEACGRCDYAELCPSRVREGSA